jgi:mono/diheme cytochrome c family protein
MRRWYIALTLSTLPTVAFAQDTGNAQHGHTLATTVCAACHAVEAKGGPSANGAAPPFAAVAATPGMTAMALNAFIYTPHHLMPDITISPADARDLIAYILSLKPQPPI